MLDIGIVYYRIRPSGNIIDAIWHSSRQLEKETGTGIAHGDTSNGFEGNYTITYFNPDGSVAGVFDLKIEKTGDTYALSYIQDSQVLLMGVGLETSDGLAAGYRKSDPTNP